MEITELGGLEKIGMEIKESGDLEKTRGMEKTESGGIEITESGGIEKTDWLQEERSQSVFYVAICLKDMCPEGECYFSSNLTSVIIDSYFSSGSE